MKRENHYEAAFEHFLRDRGFGVVPVVETRRSYLDEAEVKSPDFIVVGRSSGRLVVDVKGRQFPSLSAGKPRLTWQNWSTVGDVDGLARWSGRFGDGFQGILALVHQRRRSPGRHPDPSASTAAFRTWPAASRSRTTACT
ncbi:MAG: HYExAFE family protein [Gemmataceae bacterium]